MDEVKYAFDYMLADIRCSHVVVYKDGTVEVENFVDNIILTAFGMKKNITEDDVDELLEERCFPRSRANCQQLLESGGFEVYDPMAIAIKTEGRMSDDEFWLKFYEGEMVNEYISCQ